MYDGFSIIILKENDSDTKNLIVNILVTIEKGILKGAKYINRGILLNNQ